MDHLCSHKATEVSVTVVRIALSNRHQHNSDLRMPPKKTKAAGTPARQPAMRKEKTMCDLCCAAVVEGKEEALQCEGECQLWFHRYCAGVSSSYFKELSSSSKPFVCLSCAHKTQQAVVSTLQSELAALRVEMDELRAALDRARETGLFCD